MNNNHEDMETHSARSHSMACTDLQSPAPHSGSISAQNSQNTKKCAVRNDNMDDSSGLCLLQPVTRCWSLLAARWGPVLIHLLLLVLLVVACHQLGCHLLL
ncbi:hypothetical protein GN956_G15866 [Arapaima gigas]